MEHRPEEYAGCIVEATVRRERLNQQTRVASAARGFVPTRLCPSCDVSIGRGHKPPGPPEMAAYYSFTGSATSPLDAENSAGSFEAPGWPAACESAHGPADDGLENRDLQLLSIGLRTFQQ